jgi:hypothetical protein
MLAHGHRREVRGIVMGALMIAGFYVPDSIWLMSRWVDGPAGIWLTIFWLLGKPGTDMG